MNCKSGDLAVIVRAHGAALGRLVRCVRISPVLSSQTTTSPLGDGPPEPIWEIEGKIPAWTGEMVGYVPDACLRPIRDPGDDAVDETLLRLPSPRQEVTA